MRNISFVLNSPPPPLDIKRGGLSPITEAIHASRVTLYASLLLFLFFLSFPAFGRDKLTMAFIYPGGEGSVEEAQPILDRFFDLIQKKGGLQVSGAYYPTLEEGISAVQSGKIQAGIISLETWLTQRKKYPMEILLATLPAASNHHMERYFLLTTKATAETLGQVKSLEVYTSRPVNPVFFKSILMTNRPTGFDSNLPLQTAPNFLGQLKKIASEEATGAALLDNHEYVSLKKLNLDWVKNLKLVYSSPQINTSPVVLFGSSLPETEKQKLILTLMALADSLDGREVLKSLRLKGFVQPSQESYRALADIFDNALLAAPTIPASSPN